MSNAALAEIGHNSNEAPLAELLTEETEALRRRADELVAASGRAAVTDDESAAKGTLLCKMLKQHTGAIEDARKARKEPFLEAGRTVDAHFAALAKPVQTAAAAVLAMVDAYRRKVEAEAAAERRRIEDEARKAAAEARAAEEAARQAGQMTIENEIAIQQQRDHAAALAEQAKATTAAPIVSDYGAKASARKVWKFEITDKKEALKHALKVNPAVIHAAVEQVIADQVKAKVREFPGARIYEDSQTVIR